MKECQRMGPHDHPDARLPAWFHEWLQGKRHKAPPLHSWKSRRSLRYPSGSSAGLNARKSRQIPF